MTPERNWDVDTMRWVMALVQARDRDDAEAWDATIRAIVRAAEEEDRQLATDVIRCMCDLALEAMDAAIGAHGLPGQSVSTTLEATIMSLAARDPRER